MRRTTGVFPFHAPGAACDLVRADPDLVGEQDLAVIGLRPGVDRRPGLLVPRADRFRIPLDGPLVGPLEGQSPALEVLADPGTGEADSVQIEDQPAYLPPRPQLTRKPQAGRRVIEDGLPHGGLLGLGQNLMLTRAPTLRPGQQRVPPAGPPPRPPVVHGPDRHPEQSGDLHPVPALHQRRHRQQPHSLLRVRRPTPRIPHHITHTPSTSLHPKRFGSITHSPRNPGA
ncbi:peptidase C14, caspase catalytic subunit p20 [Streptomyces sp. SPB074]|nr:peptidase C14, caspase catalytic subunit p20 [Streptomyces sp. SPB074]